MSDRQDKSDDLIAELAKLMATTPDPQPKPAPRLVSDNAPKPVPPTIRIPGMDAPVPTGTAAAPKPAAPTPTAAAPSPFAVRIPGGDRPLGATPAPNALPTSAPAAASTGNATATPAVTVAPAATAPAAAVAAKPATVRSFDFGTLPPAATIKPEPLAHWQDREIPRPVPARPPVAEAPRPVETAPKSEVATPSVEAEATEVPAAKAAIADAPKADVTAAPDFDFDFGLTNPVSPAPAPAPAVGPSKPAAAASDPIAELIAAALDGDKPSAADPKTSFAAKAAAPAPRAVPTAATAVGPVPLRPVGGSAPRIVPGGARPVSRIPVESDSFAEAPVFTAPEADKAPAATPPATAKAELDPIDEIESLIGEAVRIGLQAEKPAPQPVVPAVASAPAVSAPVVPPLTTGFAPRRAALKDPQPQVAPAEAAILAAAAASGAEISRANVNTAPNPYARKKAPRDRRASASGSIRQYVGVAVAAVLLLAAGFGLYWVLGMGHGNDAAAPVLTADTTPVKEAPPPAATAPDTQGAVVFNQMAASNAPAGAAPAAPAEQLVSHDSSAETTVADVATTVGDDTADAGDSPLANRKVRTVTVRPDGTIVSGDDSVAGSEALPVDRPNVPLLPGADVQKPTLLAAVPGKADDPVAAAIKESDGTQGAPASSQVAALVDPSTTGTIDTSIVAPVPAPRPADRGALVATAKPAAPPQPAAPAPTQPVNLLGAATPTAPVAVTPVKPAAPAPAPAASNVAALSSGGAAAYVQLSSQKTQADAQTQLSRANSKWGSLFQGEKLEIQKAEVGNKGTFYRVRLPADSLQEATQICASIKANGGDCFPTNG